MIAAGDVFVAPYSGTRLRCIAVVPIGNGRKKSNIYRFEVIDAGVAGCKQFEVGEEQAKISINRKMWVKDVN